MAAGSVLGMPAVRPSFLEHVSAAGTREGREAGGDGASIVTSEDNCAYECDDGIDDDDDLDDDDDFDDDDDHDRDDDEDDDEEDEDEEEEETWQVTRE